MEQSKIIDMLETYQWTVVDRRGKVMEMLVKMAEVLVKIAVMMMVATAAFRRHRRRGAPFFLFFLDLLPRWEKGFPSGPWPPWHGRGESPFKIGSISLSLSISAFPDFALSPFLIFQEMRNSNFAEILTRFFPDITFLAFEV